MGNVIALGFLQMANYVFPFLTVPYLSRVLSVEHYGLILFSFSFTAYFGILCDYGFNLSATRDIAVNSKNNNQINQIVSSVTVIKIFLFLASLVANLIIIFSVARFREYWPIYFLNCFALINNVFFPTWFFQGVEKMRYITVIQVVIRTVSVILIFVFIHSDSQYYLWPVINVVTSIVSAIFAQLVLIKFFKIRYVLPDWRLLWGQLKDGWYIFISTVAISLYTISNSFFLGILTSSVMVAYYASAEKILNAIQGLLGVVSQALFPHLTKLINEDRALGIKALQRAFFKLALLGFFISLFLFLTAPLIVKILFGERYLVATTQVLRILSVLPFIICLSNIFGIQTMLPFGYTKQFSHILIITSSCNLLFTILLVPHYSYIGTAISVVLTEILVAILMYWSLYVNGVNIICGKLNHSTGA